MAHEEFFAQSEVLNYLVYGILGVVLLVLLKKHFNGGIFDTTELNLQGKHAVITGGNSGIGAQTTKFLASKGCSVIIGARDKQTAEQVIKECKQSYPSSVVEFIQLNLASQQSIKSFASSVSFPKIDYMINNAGVMAIPTKKTTAEGLEMQWGVNHQGHFYLTYLLWSKIVKSSSFRVINVSSLSHKKTLRFFKGPTPSKIPTPGFQDINYNTSYDPNAAYSKSKLYNVLFTHALAEKINPKQGKVLSLHPGVVRTNLLREMTSEGAGKLLNIGLFIVYPLYWFFTKSSYQGCQTTLHCLFSDNVENGSYYADCKKDAQNPNVTRQNWERLWEISEQTSGITFKP